VQASRADRPDAAGRVHDERSEHHCDPDARFFSAGGHDAHYCLGDISVNLAVDGTPCLCWALRTRVRPTQRDRER
jgi:hypothetical protein